MCPRPPGLKELGDADRPQVPALRFLAPAASRAILEARIGSHLGGDASLVVVRSAQQEHTASGVAESGEQVALALADLGSLGESHERFQVPAHQRLLIENVGEAVAEGHEARRSRHLGVLPRK